MVVSHFSDLWSVVSKENSKVKAFPFFFWVFFPILVFSSLANITDIRLVVGTISWFLISYGSGTLVVRLGRHQKVI